MMLACLLLATSGCSKLTGEKADDKASAANTATLASNEVAFAGSYMSNWGPCSLAQQGTSVSGTCTRGTTMTCQANGSTLNCDWREASGAGKATLTRQSSGVLSGTWGQGASATNGGAWSFTPQR
jgi:hypothetical protein